MFTTSKTIKDTAKAGSEAKKAVARVGLLAAFSKWWTLSYFRIVVTIFNTYYRYIAYWYNWQHKHRFNRNITFKYRWN